MSGQSAKKSINWHTGWLGKKPLHTRWSAAMAEQTRCQSARSKRKGEGGSSQKKAEEANTEKWEKKVQNLKGKIQDKKGFIEEQNNIQKSALAKGEKMKLADALRHNLRAAELARMIVERESRDLTDLQEQLARHLGKKPKKLLTGHIS